MATHGEGHVAGYTPAHTNQGWGFALLICALAAALWITAWVVHRNTYLHPTDPRWHAIEPQHGAGHAAPAGEGHPDAPPTPPATAPTGGGH